MSKHLETGQRGEHIAAEFLEKKGWRIAERNYRAGRGEIDLIAWANERLLVFVEVKTRSSDRFGPPEFFITPQQQRMLAGAASVYCEKIEHPGEIRFDVISIILRDDGKTKLEYLKDAFWPGL